ncbi:hypothetical protein DL98DRAFT_595160 [Cadophora sp. DSE1049]|nr:hypothetical protein DL98DRAFT_595160 [Cadophora sp. DSE1049]
MATLSSEGQGLERPPPQIPLLYYVEKVERAIHEFSNDEKAEDIFEENFSPDAFISINKEPMNLAAFKTWLFNYRKKYLFLAFEFFNPVSVISDKDGKGGTVGFAVKTQEMGKDDNKLWHSDLVAIFEVTWFPDSRDPAGGKRLITKAFGAIGEFKPVIS